MPPITRLLWVSVEPPNLACPLLSKALAGCSCEVVAGPLEALSHLKATGADVILASFPLADWTPAELLEEIQRGDSRIPVLIHDPEGTADGAFRLGGMGAYHFFSGPLDPIDLAQRLEAVVQQARSRDLGCLGAALSGGAWRNLLVGESRAIQHVVEVIRLVGARRCTVLITGETGTGKEMAARALHMAGPRAQRPLVTVSCSALPEHLLEAELFGHVKGAFTGAINNRIGRFEQADGGSLFLDEIGDMPLDLQVKLLRVLQEREFQRLGSSETIRVDIRVVAASNCDLPERVRQGKFREDPYYRLNVVPIAMPSLRERLGDVPLLVEHFIEKICWQEGLPHKMVRKETLDRLCCHAWPGNVRQLENAVEMAVALSGDRKVLYPGDFPSPPNVSSKPVHTASSLIIAIPDHGLDFEETMRNIERNTLDQALRKAGGNKQRAADMLRLKRTTLSAKLRSMDARTACAR
ncbi:MAG: sigma-54 dependent transcriptional regulator [Acidobacteria bacterium]|nr:sigma-54 dependent transcriptional regulator [Acidobacteriota bacterium]